jgi:Helix-turn-helix domain
MAGNGSPKQAPGHTPVTDASENRVFSALSDATRRHLLDRLNIRDGQRLGELSADCTISRQAIKKHLEVLEKADLVVVRRFGHETCYFLNRFPIRLIQSRWIDKFTQLDARVDCG